MTATGQHTHQQCFDREVLADFALGKLPIAEAERIAAEVETCPACQAVLDTLDSLEDSVIADLKAYAGFLPLPPELEQQIREAEQISRLVWGCPKAEPLEEPLPDRLGQYQIVERIGQGGMGVVYKALHTRLKRIVAIKVLSPHRLQDPEAIARFQREMEAVGQLDHPHLVRAYDAGEVEGRPFLVMEFLDGVDLARLVRHSHPLSIANACEAIRQAALGLKHAHEHGLIHRDIKPSNSMLTVDGMVKVLDLGLARLVPATVPSGDGTNTGQIVGTGDFIAPEQGQDARKADARSDLYSLGCTFYFLLAGRAPFSGPQYDTLMKKVLAHSQEPILSIRSIRDDVPPSLAKLLERMLAKEAANRPQTAGEVAEALAPLANGADLKELVTKGSLPSTTPSLSSATSGLPRRTHLPSAALRTTANRGDAKHSWRPVVMAIVAVLVLSSLGIGWWAFAHRVRLPRLSPTMSLPLSRERGEESLRVSGKPRLAVLYFENNSADARSLTALEKGLCAMMIGDLTASGDYQVVERERIEAVLRELKLSHEVGFDQATAARVGRLLGAQQLVLGSYFELLEHFRIDARIVDVETGVTLAASGVEGEPAHFGKLLHTLSADLLTKWRQGPAPKELMPRLAVKEGTRSSPAPPMTVVTRFGEALDAYDRGDQKTARQIVREVLASNDTFDPACRLLSLLDGTKSPPVSPTGR
jgi:serine/threonine protein kinase